MLYAVSFQSRMLSSINEMKLENESQMNMNRVAANSRKNIVVDYVIFSTRKESKRERERERERELANVEKGI